MKIGLVVLFQGGWRKERGRLKNSDRSKERGLVKNLERRKQRGGSKKMRRCKKRVQGKKRIRVKQRLWIERSGRGGAPEEKQGNQERKCD